MTDASTEFFEALEARGPHPALRNTRGTIRFDLTDAGKRTTRWLVAIDTGNVAVSRKNEKADCVVRADKTLFDGIASGEQNGLAAVLRGAMQIEGDPAFVQSFQRLFPGPPRRDS